MEKRVGPRRPCHPNSEGGDCMKRTLIPVISSIVLSWTSASAQPLGYQEMGLAAVYANALDGHVTASGQIYNKAKLTAAHKTLLFGTKVRVTNPKNSKTVILLVNDRGPVQSERILDISPAAASRLGFSSRGVREVTLEVVGVGSGKVTREAHR